MLNKFTVLEKFLLDNLEGGEQSFLLKELNEKALNSGIKSSTVNGIKTIFYYWTIKGYIEKSVDAMANRINIELKTDLEKLKSERNKCVGIAKFIVSYLYDRSLENKSDKEEILVLFSIFELKNAYESSRISSADNEDIENALQFVEIKTFHSYCFDLLGKIGSIENSKNVVSDAAQMIRDGKVELGKITKTVIVIDEAQDMDGSEFALIEALMERNEDMRVIAVGDDDQNIYGFRGSDSKYMRSFIIENGAAKYELTENYRSCRSIVAFANAFAETITDRMKIEPITAVNGRNGELQLIRHRSYSLDEAVANHVIASYDGSGAACVLTSTNEEVIRAADLLQKKERCLFLRSTKPRGGNLTACICF